MKINYLEIKTKSIEILIPFALYWFFIGFMSLIPDVQSKDLTYYLFLPAGVKLFSVLIFRINGAVGIALAVFLRLMLTNPSQLWFGCLIISIVLTLALYVVVEGALQLFRVERNLSNLNYYQIVGLAFITSVVNGFLFSYVASAFGISQMSSGPWHKGAEVVLGNFAGNAAFVCLAMFLFKHKNFVTTLIKIKIDRN